MTKNARAVREEEEVWLERLASIDAGRAPVTRAVDGDDADDYIFVVDDCTVEWLREEKEER